MCKKPKGVHNRIDKCIKPLIQFLKDERYYVVASCCGHGKYPLTIVCKFNGKCFELLTAKTINRKRKFYKKDKQEYYFIPEVIENEK